MKKTVFQVCIRQWMLILPKVRKGEVLKGTQICINKGVQFCFFISLIKLPYVSISKFWFVYSQNVSYVEDRYSFFFALKNDIMYNEILEI